MIGSDVFVNTSTGTNIVSGGIHAIRYELGCPIKILDLKLFELCRQIQQVPKKKWESASDFSCQIRFALELEHASNVYSVFPRRRLKLGLCKHVI